MMILRLTFGVFIQMAAKISRNPTALGVSAQERKHWSLSYLKLLHWGIVMSKWPRWHYFVHVKSIIWVKLWIIFCFLLCLIFTCLKEIAQYKCMWYCTMFLYWSHNPSRSHLSLVDPFIGRPHLPCPHKIPACHVSSLPVRDGQQHADWCLVNISGIQICI